MPVPFRTLSSFLPAAAAHLERRITTMEAHLRSSGWNLTAVNSSSTENVAVVGRICHNADSATSSIATLELEGSRAGSDGARVRLDCALLTTCSFFPGQIVGIKGRNPTGACLTAHSVVDAFPALDSPASASPPEQAALPSRIVIAAGPFVPGTGQLTFQALHAVLHHCRAVQPDTLLLCGPFIPDTHPALKTLRVTFQQLFAQQVRSCRPSAPPSGPTCEHVLLRSATTPRQAGAKEVSQQTARPRRSGSGLSTRPAVLEVLAFTGWCRPARTSAIHAAAGTSAAEVLGLCRCSRHCRSSASSAPRRRCCCSRLRPTRTTCRCTRSPRCPARRTWTCCRPPRTSRPATAASPCHRARCSLT